MSRRRHRYYRTRPQSQIPEGYSVVGQVRDILSEQRGWTVLDVALVGFNEVYAAVARPGEPVRTWCARTCYPEYGQIVKFDVEMWEGEPYNTLFTRCPERILARLPFSEDVRVQEWRARSRDFHESRKRRITLPDGARIRFARSLRVGRTQYQAEFILVRWGRQKRKVRFQDPATGTYYKIANWTQKDFSIISLPTEETVHEG